MQKMNIMLTIILFTVTLNVTARQITRNTSPKQPQANQLQGTGELTAEELEELNSPLNAPTQPVRQQRQTQPKKMCGKKQCRKQPARPRQTQPVRRQQTSQQPQANQFNQLQGAGELTVEEAGDLGGAL